MNTGVEIDESIVVRLLSSTEDVEKQYKDFVDCRIKSTGDDRTNFCERILNLKIKTGLEKEAKKRRR